MAAPSNRRLQTALALAGVSVFPCKENKAPATRRGFKDASCDPEVIKGWFANPSLLIGVPTGKTNDLFVVDVDPNGLEWLEANQEDLDPLASTAPGEVNTCFTGIHQMELA